MVDVLSSKLRGYAPSVSVVICTDGRRNSLRDTLDALSRLDFDAFEVCVVVGPTPDGSAELAASWPHPIKVRHCPKRNLSLSRNIGIAAAAGDIVALLDDDAIPEPEWLTELVQPYANPKVGASGGLVLNHTGAQYQYRFCTVDRLANATVTERATPEFNFPYSQNVPHMLGANSSFRRNALIEVNGFDEEFEYYLDETDVQLRVLDRGWQIAQVSGAHVHHRYLPSDIRSENKAVRAWYSLIKNKIYFGLKHRAGFHSMEQVIETCQKFVQHLLASLRNDVKAGKLDDTDIERFHREIELGWQHGLARGLEGIRPPRGLDEARVPAEFLPHPTIRPRARKGVFCFLSQDYPPGKIGGVARYIHALATGLAREGHQIHVLTGGQGHDRVDFENGTWVHRITHKHQPGRPADIPERMWNHSRTMLAEIEEIAKRRPVDCVYSPIWDCEGIAALRSGAFPIVVGLQTMLKSYAASNPQLASDSAFVENVLQPGIRIEAEMLRDAAAIHAISAAIGRQAEDDHGVPLGQRVHVIPIGLDDNANPKATDDTTATDEISVLFVGRIEARKGIDALLAAIGEVAPKHRHVKFRLVGDEPVVHGQPSYRHAFAERHPDFIASAQVEFLGGVTDEVLAREYRDCDIFVAPSRFESFGLIFVEAMMFSKPVVGTAVGGVVEVVDHGRTGLLVPPDDPHALATAIETLANDPVLRAQMGHAGRLRYEERFTSRHMVLGVEKLMLATRDRVPAISRQTEYA